MGRGDPEPAKGAVADAASVGAVDRRIAVAIALVAMVVFNANLRPIGAGDTYPARIIPFALLTHGTLFLDDFLDAARAGHSTEDSYWIQPARDGRRASLYPAVTPLLVTPLYIPAKLVLDERGWDLWRVVRVSILMEKLAASTVAALASGLVYMLLRRRIPRNLSVVLTVAFAFGTNTWMIASQALWQHGPAELLVVIALLCLTSPAPTARVAVIAGLTSGLLVMNRPPDVAIAAAIAFVALVRWRPFRYVYLVAAALPVFLFTWYNLEAFGLPLGGYQQMTLANEGFFYGDLLDGVAGMLASPTHGLFFFSPVFLLLLLFGAKAFSRREDRLLNGAMLAAALGVLLLHAKADWRGGLCFGPRFLTDVLPILVWLLAPIVAELTKLARIVFAVLCVVSIAVQAVGAFYFQGAGFGRLYDDRAKPGPVAAAWEVENSPLFADVRNGPAALVFGAWLRDGLLQKHERH